MKVLVVEDGFEYSQMLERFLAEGFVWSRAGSGPEALKMLEAQSYDALFLDMRFDRIAPELLLGDLKQVADRFNGDPLQARTFLQNNQGNFILNAIRQTGCELPALMSYDFDAEPRRWAHIKDKFAPVDYLEGNATPPEIAQLLHHLGEGPS